MEGIGSPLDRAELRSLKSSIAKDVILSIITLGIYNVYWQYRQMKFVNSLAGEEKFSFIKWLIFTIITCGIYHIYYEYVMGRELVTLQEKLGLPKSGDLPAIGVVLSIVGLTIVTDAIQQREINTMVDKIFEKPV